MYVFIDESFDEKIFLMAAIRSPNRDNIEECIKQTRSYLRKRKKSGNPIPNIPEFKEYVLHHSYLKIKYYLLNRLVNYYFNDNFFLQKHAIEILYVWAKYNQKNIFNDLYLHLAQNLLTMIKSPIKNFVQPRYYDIYFDLFGDGIFRQKLKNSCLQTFPEYRISFNSSSQIKGLQTADIAAGTIRRFISGGDAGGYKIIEPLIKESKQIFSPKK